MSLDEKAYQDTKAEVARIAEIREAAFQSASCSSGLRGGIVLNFEVEFGWMADGRICYLGWRRLWSPAYGYWERTATYWPGRHD